MTLFDPGPADRLTERQQLVMAAIGRAGEDGIRAPQAGAAIHSNRGIHSHNDECRYCHSEGAHLLRRLQELGHVTRDRHGNWRATGQTVEAGSLQGDLPETF
jgi:hypothetical protein